MIIKDQNLHWWGPAVEEHPEFSDAIIHMKGQPEACAKQNVTVHEPSLSLCISMCLWTHILLLTCPHVLRASSTNDLRKSTCTTPSLGQHCSELPSHKPFPSLTLQAIPSHQCDYSLLALHKGEDVILCQRQAPIPGTQAPGMESAELWDVVRVPWFLPAVGGRQLRAGIQQGEICCPSL